MAPQAHEPRAVAPDSPPPPPVLPRSVRLVTAPSPGSFRDAPSEAVALEIGPLEAESLRTLVPNLTQVRRVMGGLALGIAATGALFAGIFDDSSGIAEVTIVMVLAMLAPLAPLALLPSGRTVRHSRTSRVDFRGLSITDDADAARLVAPLDDVHGVRIAERDELRVMLRDGREESLGFAADDRHASAVVAVLGEHLRKLQRASVSSP
ncbi:MAG: hypothetical protein K8H88_21405 [Sandaracinaceae bacterium]|nr:hypothetical protein [Sandaracinaceae bacterium]